MFGVAYWHRFTLLYVWFKLIWMSKGLKLYCWNFFFLRFFNTRNLISQTPEIFDTSPLKHVWSAHNSEKCVAMATRCQILANALDDIKYHISATSEDIWTTSPCIVTTMWYPMVVWYWVFKVKDHWHWKKWLFGEITGPPFTVSSALFKQVDSEAYIQYFVESFYELVKLVT